MHPVLAGFSQLDAHSRGLDRALVHDLAPVGRADRLTVLFHLDGRGRDAPDLYVAGAGVEVLDLAPALQRALQELFVGRLRQREDVRGVAAVDAHVDVERLGRGVRVLEHDAGRPAALPRKGMFVEMAERDARQDEARPRGDDLQRLHDAARLGVRPSPEVEPSRPLLDALHLAPAHLVPLPLAAGHQSGGGVGHGEKRRSGHARDALQVLQRADLESFSKRYPYLHAAGEAEDVVGHGGAQRTAGVQHRLHHPVRYDDATRRLADRNRDAARLPVEGDQAIGGGIIAVPYLKRQPSEILRAGLEPAIFAEDGCARVIVLGDIERFVVGHVKRLLCSEFGSRRPNAAGGFLVLEDVGPVV